MADKLIISYVNFNLTMRHWLSITFKTSFKARWTNPIFSCRKLYPITPHNISVYHKPDLMVHRASEKKKPKQNKKKEKKNVSKFNEYTCYTSKYFILFSSKLASGWNPPNPAIWLVPRVSSFLRSCLLTQAESWQLYSQVCLLFVNEQNRWFLTIFLLKLALLLVLARGKWILLFRQNIWRENQVSEPGKPLK